ncbi:hypothetical protein D3C87_2061660 [compost metagenome]
MTRDQQGRAGEDVDNKGSFENREMCAGRLYRSVRHGEGRIGEQREDVDVRHDGMTF